ncbi:hypothetical protein L1987_08152 [Smallanthus sonchifolius]|uniref:Uncharacterized protein n=1 Tax=Smallanthus sonchifolius TaxID=185202 RepID=A0ACB9JJU2_9ASTR|nr:hypothetical protein L1987_08152 [Smallanthus sonchifolius]
MYFRNLRASGHAYGIVKEMKTTCSCTATAIDDSTPEHYLGPVMTRRRTAPPTTTPLQAAIIGQIDGEPHHTHSGISGIFPVESVFRLQECATVHECPFPVESLANRRMNPSWRQSRRYAWKGRNLPVRFHDQSFDYTDGGVFDWF